VQFNDPIEIADDTQAGERSVDHRPNATHQVFKSIEDISDEEWELTFKVNIHAMFYLTNGAVAHIKPASATPPRSPNLSLAREGRDGDDGAGGGREVGGCAGRQ
jgi:NAD(P)-dependent dehydrogenase (short-subunit alcohol dehydrogenase family)